MFKKIIHRALDVLLLLLSFWNLNWGRNKARTHLLIVRLDAIGDFFMWLAPALEIRKKFPKSRFHITLVGNAHWIQMAQDLLDFDHYIALDRQQFMASFSVRKNIAKEIKRKKYILAMNPTYSREWASDWLIGMACAKEKIGFDGPCNTIKKGTKFFTNFLYSKLLHSPAQTELEHNEFFIQQTINPDFRLQIPDFSKKEKRQNQIVIFPGSSWHGKCWPSENFAELITWLSNNFPGNEIILAGGKNDVTYSEIIKSKINVTVTDLVGKTSLKDLLALLSNSKLLISNDTSAVHMAQVTRTPTIALVGGGHWGRFLPYSPHIKNENIFRVLNEKLDCYFCDWKCKFNIQSGEACPCLKNINLEILQKTIKTIKATLLQEGNF